MQNNTETIAKQGQRSNCLRAKNSFLKGRAKPPLIFTDLDGSLLDHENYSFAKAGPALRLITAKSIPLIINSSKTKAEILEIRSLLHNEHPFVVENGAAIFIPQDYFPGYTQSPLSCILLGASRSELLEVLKELRARYSFAFESFSDMGPAKIADVTGLTLKQATMANDRMGSEPLSWLGDDKSLAEFKKLLAKKHLSLVEGGRFWHVMGQVDKAEAMRWLQKQFQKAGSVDYLSIALGDSENDRRMLESADVAVVIKNCTGKHLALKEQGRQVIYTESPGAKGWNESIVQLFGGTKLEHKHE